MPFEFGPGMRLEILQPEGGPLEVGGRVRVHFDREAMQASLHEELGDDAPTLRFVEAEDALEPPREEPKPPTFTVWLEDNNHPGERVEGGTFETADESLDYARNVIDAFLSGETGKTTEQLYDAFLHFGETPRIPGVAFDARGYVRSRCDVLGIEPPPEPAPLASAPPGQQAAAESAGSSGASYVRFLRGSAANMRRAAAQAEEQLRTQTPKQRAKWETTMKSVLKELPAQMKAMELPKLEGESLAETYVRVQCASADNLDAQAAHLEQQLRSFSPSQLAAWEQSMQHVLQAIASIEDGSKP